MKTYEEAVALLNETYASWIDDIDTLSVHELEAKLDMIAFVYGVERYQVMQDAGLAL